jgi:hypothetical protein
MPSWPNESPISGGDAGLLMPLFTRPEPSLELKGRDYAFGGCSHIGTSPASNAKRGTSFNAVRCKDRQID